MPEPMGCLSPHHATHAAPKKRWVRRRANHRMMWRKLQGLRIGERCRIGLLMVLRSLFSSKAAQLWKDCTFVHDICTFCVAGVLGWGSHGSPQSALKASSRGPQWGPNHLVAYYVGECSKCPVGPPCGLQGLPTYLTTRDLEVT